VAATIKYHFCEGPHVEIIGGGPADRYQVAFHNLSANRLEQETVLRADTSTAVPKAYFQKWRLQISHNGKPALDYTLDLKGQRVVITGSVGLGDTLAWTPYVEEFRKRHGCRVVYCCNYPELLAKSYPEIEFVQKMEHDQVLAVYKIGCANPPETQASPRPWNRMNLQDLAKSILGLEDLPELRPKVQLDPKVKKPAQRTVCIGTESTFKGKQWNYPGGWEALTAWLIQQGYRVLNLSVDGPELPGVELVAEDETLTAIASHLNYCDFFVGLTSGLSWMAWALHKPVVMISGMTEPWHEFADKIHVGPPKGTCTGCIHRHRLDRHQFDWCPDRQDFACTATITPETVQRAVDRLIPCAPVAQNPFLTDMNKPQWSFVLIAKNEAKTLPRFLASIQEFTDRGGKTVIVDTGSTDGTPAVARQLGCIVYEEGTRFITTLSDAQADAINAHFIVGNEAPVVARGQKLFDYSAARNFAASCSPTDIVAMPDCDEAWTKLNIDVVNQAIASGIERFEYNFVFSHDQFGNEVIKFLHSKFYDRRKVHWEGIVHELLMGESRAQFFDESVLKLEHWQNPESNRGGYLPGLALDCFEHPEKDRNSHYFAREMMFNGRFKSAIKEFERHVAMDRWLPEKAQSVIHIGDCWFYLGDEQKSLEHYFKAYVLDGSRREALIRIAQLYYKKNDHQRTAAFAAAALTIPWNNFYCNQMSEYTFTPHELLYISLWWLGDRQGSKEHWEKAFSYCKFNPRYVSDGQFYYDYADSGVEGWMNYRECVWLNSMAKKMNSICEIGSWKGRSTGALLKGCPGTVTAVDHFKGSTGEDIQHAEAKHGGDSVYNQFLENTKQYLNLSVHRAASPGAAKDFLDGEFDMVFIDGGHTYADVKADIRAWRSKARLLLCGHDYAPEWPDVRRAVHEEVGTVDHHETIWYKWLVNPMISVVIPTLGRPEKLERLLNLIKENAGYTNYEVIVMTDDWPPHNTGVPVLVKEAVAKSNGELVMYLGNDCVPEKDFMLQAVLDMARWFPKLDGLIGLNDGYWQGEMATHWLASKQLLPYLGYEFFHTGYFHTGCDNELTERCRLLNKYAWSERSVVRHDHPIQTGFLPDQLDDVLKFAYEDRRRHHDLTLLHDRSKLFGFKETGALIQPVVPRKIFSIWLSEDGSMPELIRKCLNTHTWPGYQHVMIHLGNCFKGTPYIQSCLQHKLWAQAADYLRAYYLWTQGGIYLDADMEVLKDFDSLRTCPLTVEREDNGFIANSFISAQKDHRLLRSYLDMVDARPFDPKQENGTWHNGMGAWTVVLQDALNAQAKDLQVLEIGSLRGIVNHHFARTWTPNPKALTPG